MHIKCLMEWILLSIWGTKPLENGNASLLSNSLVLCYFSVITERFENHASKVDLVFLKALAENDIYHYNSYQIPDGCL